MKGEYKEFGMDRVNGDKPWIFQLRAFPKGWTSCKQRQERESSSAPPPTPSPRKKQAGPLGREGMATHA